MDYKNNFDKVLSIGPQYQNPRGGMGAVLATYARHIEDFKFISVYDDHYGTVPNTIYFFGAFFQILWRLLIDRTIEIIHLHGASRGSFYRMYIVFLLSKFFFGKKVIYHLHGGGFHVFYGNANSLIKKAVQHLMRKTDLVICLSQYWYKYLNNQFLIQRLQILNNPVNPPTCLNRKTNKNNQVLNTLFLGLIGKGKGIFDLLDVLVENRETFGNKLNLTVGGNGDTEKLKRFISDNKLESSVKFQGWVSGEKKHQLLSSSDILILPSYNEGLPMSILEAMSYGLAIIASNVGGIPEVVKEDENGYLITPGDKQQLGLYLKKLIDSPSVVKRLGKNSRTKIKKYFISNVLNELNNIYYEVLN